MVRTGAIKLRRCDSDRRPSKQRGSTQQLQDNTVNRAITRSYCNPYSTPIDIKHTMKIQCALLACSALLSSVTAFAPQPLMASTPTRLGMFGGAGAGVPSEDDPEQVAAMEAAAKQMGVPLDEYKLGMKARARLMSQLDAARCQTGETATVAIERDAHNPPQHLVVTITEAGKALGAEQVGKKLVSALKDAAEASKKKRGEAQGDMMQFISQEMKISGKA